MPQTTKKTSLPFLNMLGSKLAWPNFKTIGHHFTFKNLFIVLAGIAIASFVLQSVIRTMFYVNILFIVQRVLYPKQLPAQDHSKLRQAALLAALASVVLDFAIAPTSLVAFVLLAPLSSFIVYDETRLAYADAKKHSDKNWLMRPFYQLFTPIKAHWHYFTVAAPYLHRTLISGMYLLLHSSVIAASPTFQAIYAIVSYQHLPMLLSTLSLIGGLNLAYHSKQAVMHTFTHYQDYFWNLAVSTVKNNPVLSHRLMSAMWTTFSGHTDDQPANIDPHFAPKPS